MSGTNIEWTEATWNPVVGCTPVSPGCLNCYAATMAVQLEGMGTRGYTPVKGIRIAEVRDRRAVYTGSVRLVPEALMVPLRRKMPTTYFLASMGDVFHADVPFDYLDRIWAVMALCPQHTFQVLTKRPERAAEYLARPWLEDGDRALAALGPLPAYVTDWPMLDLRGPLPNVWLITSVEDQTRADERIPHLLRCPAAVRGLSVEPLLGRVDLHGVLPGHACNRCNSAWYGSDPQCPRCSYTDPMALATHDRVGVDWVIVGGESGHNARPCDVGHIEHVVNQCDAAGVPVFIKQMGSRPGYTYPTGPQVRAWGETAIVACDDGVLLRLRDRKGGDMGEWPEHLRRREWPRGALVEMKEGGK